MKKKATEETKVNNKLSAKPIIYRKLRRDRDLTQQKVAALIGVKQPTYQGYESGTITPPPEKLAKLAELFGVTTDYLLGREPGRIFSPLAVVDAMWVRRLECQRALDVAFSRCGTDQKRLAALANLLHDFSRK